MTALWKRSQVPRSEAMAADAGRVRPTRRIAHRSPAQPLEVKLLAIEAVESGLAQVEVARLIGVMPTTVSSWLRSYRQDGVSGLSRRASIGVRRRCTKLEERIVAQRQEHPEQGVRRIRDELRREEGLAVSAEKVRTTVNEAGLGNPPPESARRPPQVRRFERALPNAMWQIDIFTFQLKRMYRVYLVGMIDDHSRFIVGWGLFRQQTAEAVLEVARGAIGQWGAPREILSDNGRQFAAWRGETRFQKVLKQQGIEHVRSAPHHPMTLGKIERFWQTLWREFLSEAVFASFADACQRLEHWIQYYNHQRPHQALDGLCPADRFYGLAGDVTEALRQGCQENSLRLALGQEPQAPLYLLGQLGGTDVRVVRRGETIEVKVGETVHEVIRLGLPYTIGEDGHGGRIETAPLAADERGAAIPAARAAEQGCGGGVGAEPDVRGEPTVAVPGVGGGAGGGDRGADAEAGWTQSATGGAAEADGTAGGEEEAGAGAASDASEVRGGGGAAGPAAPSGPGGAAPGREKSPEPAEPNGYVGRWPYWRGKEAGPEE